MTETTQSEDPVLNRRRVMQILGSASVAGLAGCGGNGGDGEDTPTTTPADDNGDDNGDDTDDQDAKQGGTLKLSQVKSPLEFDPIVLNDVPSAQVSGEIFEGLYTYDEETGVIPMLATGEPEVSDDGLEWVVEMTGDATFHNGDPVTVEDVIYSFNAPVDEETENASELNMVDSVEKVDDTTVQFNLAFPYGAFKNTLTWSIVPESVREEDKEAFNMENPVGSGPFQFDSWQEGEFALVTRYDDYWGEPVANLDEVRFTPVEEATTRVTTLQNEENDVIEEIPPKLYSTIEEMDGAAIDEVPGIGYFYLAFNCNEGPTTDPKVREAVDYVFDMDAAVQNYVEPTGLRQYSPLPASVAETWDMPVDEWSEIPHGKDIDQATSLFEEAGVPMDYQWNIIVPPDDKREQIGTTVGNGLQEVGFNNVEVQRLDWGAFLDKYVTGSEDDYNMYTLGWAGTPDPDAFTYYLFGRTDDTLGVTNGTYYGNNSDAGAEAAQKFVDARESADEEERKQLYEEGITTVLEERAHLPAYNLKNSFGVRDYVKDFTSHPVSSFHLVTDHNNVWLDK